MVGVGLLMLIICANVANLLLARAMARSREMGVRLAIGAGRGRLVRQMLTESTLVAAFSALTGLAVAWWGSRGLLALVADGGRTIPLDVRLDQPVLAFTLAVTIVAVALFGLVPALRGSRVDLATAMRANAKSVTGGGIGRRGQRVPLGKLLVAGQVGLSLVLLVGATLLVRSLQSVQRVETGLDRDHLLIVDADARGRGYHGPRLLSLVGELSARLARLGGVAAVGYSENGVFSGTESQDNIQVQGFTPHSPEDSLAFSDNVGPGYFHALGTRVLQGREFDETDIVHTLPVAVVNATFARFYFGDASPVGKTIRLNDTTAMTIIGVVADTKDHQLAGATDRRFYMSFPQMTNGEPGSLRFEVRVEREPAAVVNAVRREFGAQDRLLVIDGIDPLASLMRQSVSQERLLSRLATGFGVLALLLAAVGLYGVMTYAIVRRTGEIGLRVALGAQRGDVIGLVLGDALRLVGLGLAVGVPLAFASTRLLRTQLHGVQPTDPTSLAVALSVLTASAVVAALIPALRAARVPPLVALRED
jgi:predicted permease